MNGAWEVADRGEERGEGDNRESGKRLGHRRRETGGRKRRSGVERGRKGKARRERREEEVDFRKDERKGMKE